MNRRLLGPIGGPIVFFLVAGLVFAGLGWVTVASLRVETAQREGAVNADREKDLRIALRQLDGRMLLAIGLEDTRSFDEFLPYAPDPTAAYTPPPSSARLLAADLPDWMLLHFQVDPEATWESPQVLSADTRLALRRDWPELTLRNATRERSESLRSLREKCPAKQVGEAFAARERPFPPASPRLGAPLSFNGFDDGGERRPLEEPAPVKLESLPKLPAPVIAPPGAVDLGAETLRIPDGDNKKEQPGEGVATGKRKFADKASDVQKDLQAPEPRPAPDSNAIASQDGRGGRAMQSNRSDYEDRLESTQRVRDEAKKAAAGPVLQPRGQNYLAPNTPQGKLAGNVLPVAPPISEPLGKPAASGGFAGLGGGAIPGAAGKSEPLAATADRSKQEPEKIGGEALGAKGLATKPKLDDLQLKDAAAGLSFVAPAAPKPSAMSDLKQMDKYALAARGFFLWIEEAYAKEMDKQRRGESLSRDGAKKDESRKELKDSEKAGATKAPMTFAKGGSFGFGAPAAGGPAGPPSPVAPGVPPAPGGGAGGGFDGTPLMPRPMALTPDPKPPAELEPVELPPAPPVAEDALIPPPVAVHLGSLRPQWITAADGSDVLVLVRAARFEQKKTVYQGVVLDWAKLQDVLKDEVKDLFPGAKLVPVKDAAASRERAMTALPIELDPGPTPEPPPAGWTPLRIGLVLAWVAALIAFGAVGLCGWSLIDLAERRIRFVSAVTHELRTPLTSLRLYLDLLLSGMVQDEEKRREYLSTLNVESDRLHRLIDNVLDYARLERRRKGRDLQPVKAADLLEGVRRTWIDRVAADGKELVVISTLPPEQDVRTDPSLVQQIVGNLIDNARKYTRDATDTRIWLWAKLDGANRVVFEVEDRGPGVSPRDQKVIFRAFRRGETADQKAGGAGLGLALSKEWAEVLGGKLTYTAAEGGVGCCFRLEVPTT